MATSDSNSVFADGFSSDAGAERHSQILKRFNDLRNRNARDMFFERPTFGGDWPANRSFSRSSFENDSSPFPSRSGSRDIPINVVHRGKNDDPMEHTSPNSSFGNANGKHHEARIEPRVHHIPIKVEPRDDADTNLSRSSSASSQRSGVSAGSAASGQSMNDAASTAYSTSPKSNESIGSSNATKEHIIPITVESHVKPIPKKSGSPLTADPVKLKKAVPVPGQSQSARSRNPTQAPHITRVPVRESGDDGTSQGPSALPKQQCVKPDPLKLIAAITEEVSSLEKQIEAFCGEYQDKTYLYLDEMLTRCMLKLDNIEINGQDDVRQARKSAINFINKCIAALETKVNKVRVSVTSVGEPKDAGSSQINEAEVYIAENEAVSNTEKTADAANEPSCEKPENEEDKMDGDPQENQSGLKEQDEKMVVDEGSVETKEAIENEQKSKCDETELTSTDKSGSN